MQKLHAISGGLLLIVTFVMFFYIIDKKFNWSIKTGLHPVSGLIVLFLVFVTVCLGVARIYYGSNKAKPWTTKDNAKRIAKFHRYSAYTLLLIANVTLLTGVFTYIKFHLLNDKYLPLGLLTLPCFFLIIIILEVNHRIHLRKKMMDFEIRK